CLLSFCGHFCPVVERCIARCGDAVCASLRLMHVLGHRHLYSHTFFCASCSKISAICASAVLFLCHDQEGKRKVYYRNSNPILHNANPVHHVESDRNGCGFARNGSTNR